MVDEDDEWKFFNDQATLRLDDPKWQDAWQHEQNLWKIQNDTTKLFSFEENPSHTLLATPGAAPHLLPKPAAMRDTTVAIASNLIPTFPSIDMVNATIYSLHQYLIGLPKDTPIFVSIDKPVPRILAEADNQQRLEEHIQRLRAADFSSIFSNYPSYRHGTALTPIGECL